MAIGRGQIPAQIEGKLRGARGEKRKVKLLSKGGDPRIGTGKKPKRSGRSCLLYTSPSPRDGLLSRMPSSA